ncbi:outer membrane beta-barrel protein [Salmonella enterica]|nr:outer membrane beta-barrel protein [Salmonella enterica]
MKKSIVALSVLASMVFSGSVLAYGEGDHVLKGGVNISKPIADGADSFDAGASFAASYTYMMTENVGLELSATTPAKYDDSGIYDIKKSVYSAMVNYHFGDVESAVRPYVGAGLAYTHLSGEFFPHTFYETEVKGGFGGAFQLGLDWQATENLIVGANVKYTVTQYKLENDYAKVEDTLGDVSTTFSIGYSF